MNLLTTAPARSIDARPWRCALARARTLAFAAGLAFALPACSHDSTGPGESVTPGVLVSDPAAAELSVADVQHFWAAFDEYQRTKSSSAFSTLYLGQATAGLKDFAQKRTITADAVAQMVNAFPRYFGAGRPASTRLANGELTPAIRAGFFAIKALYPAAVFPTVTFAIGRFSTGGTIANNRILIGSEFNLADDGVPTDELTSFARTNAKPLSSLPIIVAHEHVHILQSRASGIFGRSTLLEQALSEGIADFIGEQVSGGNINAWQRPYFLAHEHELWVQFQSQMSGTDVSQWLYNQGTATGERPGDLGYVMGYQIAKAYYDRAANKTQAVKDIIEVQNAATFVTASGYNP